VFQLEFSEFADKFREQTKIFHFSITTIIYSISMETISALKTSSD